MSWVFFSLSRIGIQCMLISCVLHYDDLIKSKYQKYVDNDYVKH